jgi:hypothetical protein
MEHRQHPRFPVYFRSAFVSANLASGEGHLVELSIRGCRIASLAEVKPGTALTLQIETSDKEPSLHVSEAVVRWCRNSAFGVEFTGLTPHEWARLQQLVKNLELQPYQRANQGAFGA